MPLCGCSREHTNADSATLSISCGALGVELKLCTEGVRRWEQRTGHRVQIVSTPNSSTDRLALYLQVLASGSSDLDVLQIDVVWPGILASHFIDLTPYLGDAPREMFPALVENDTVDGRLVAAPWFTDAGVLYYRADLLKAYGFDPPTTWEELTHEAQTIQDEERAKGHQGLWGFVWQGKPYEGLTCNALEWVASFGGSILADDGSVTVDGPKARAALEMAAGWVGTISPPGVLQYDEEAARGVFQTGNAVFMRNWPYAWALAQSGDSPVRGRVGVVALPRGPGEAGRHVGTLGGWQLAVSRYSKHPELAADLVRFLTSPEEQKRRAIEGAYNPTIVSLYRDPEVLEANPFFGKLFDAFAHAVARPSGIVGPQYNRVSNAFWRATHDVLAGTEPADERLGALAQELRRLRARARW
ncbi:MAG: ABC transporter substrate-binding protein [Myxococcaceae bacterium]|nr:ABC transporter substrate-binding protein [Myxococcaceae bacterium]